MGQARYRINQHKIDRFMRENGDLPMGGVVHNTSLATWEHVVFPGPGAVAVLAQCHYVHVPRMPDHDVLHIPLWVVSLLYPPTQCLLMGP